MSKRRNVGDWVQLPAFAGFLQDTGPQKAEIIGAIQFDHPGPHYTEWCVLDCGDPNCREWHNLRREDGEWLYHVYECQMTDLD